MSEHIIILGGVGVFLLVVCLAVRGSTENRLARMRAELITLRGQERGLVDRIEDAQSVQAQLREVQGRLQGRQSSTEQLLESIYDKLGRLYEFLRDEDLPKPDQPGEEVASGDGE